MLTKCINYCVNNFMMYVSEIIMLHSKLQCCQLHLNKSRRKKDISKEYTAWGSGKRKRS